MLGWVFKMFLFRDVYVCWFLSIWFELLEYSFQHILPNFAECWWDHVRPPRCPTTSFDHSLHSFLLFVIDYCIVDH